MQTNSFSGISKQRTFRPWVQKVMPTIYDESLSYYELLGKVVAYLNQLNDQANEIIDFVDAELGQHTELIRELRIEFNALYDTLTKQIHDDILPANIEIILDTWFQNGKLAEIINTNVFDMKADKTDVDEVKKKLGDTERVINALHHGVIGDGLTDDSMAMQMALLLAETIGCKFKIPAGRYYIPSTVRTSSNHTYHYMSSFGIEGDGKATVLIGDGEGLPSTSIPLANQAILAVHTSNAYVRGLSFERFKVGLYTGQDPRKTSMTHASFNTLEEIFFYYGGYCMVMENGEGVYYNKTRDIHGAHFGVGLYLADGKTSIEANNNRNYFEAMRFTRGWVGYYIKNGDGNTFNACYSEGIIGGDSAIGNKPSFMPPESGEGGIGWLMGDKATNNRIDSMSIEKCTLDIYDAGYKNSYSGIKVNDEGVEVKVHFVDPKRSPRLYLSTPVKFGNVEYQVNNSTMFGEPTVPGLSIIDGRFFDKGYHKKTANLLELAPQMLSRSSASTSIYQKIGKWVDWTINYRFQFNPATDKLMPLRIKIPDYTKLSLDDTYTKPLTALATTPFPMYTGNSSPNMQTALARFSTPEESATHGGEHLVIPAPHLGWADDSQNNYIQGTLRFNTK